MVRLDLTPWTRKALTGTDYDEIQAKAPKDSTVDIGMARRGEWTCRLRIGSRVIAETYRHPSPMAAFRAAVAIVEGKAA